MRFQESLKKHLENVLDGEELSLLPRGFQTLEDVAIINLKPGLVPKKHVVAQAILDLLPYIKSVWGKTFGQAKVVGQFRTPTGLEHLAGVDKSEVIAVENGVIFKHDFTKIIFSKGNINERSYLPRLVKPGEVVLDMFAGIGYFSLMIAKHALPAIVHACEINPVAYNYLSENIVLNKVQDTVQAYHGDCADIVPRLVKDGLLADRIVMGVFPAPKQYLPVALSAAKPISGTIIHYEGEVVDKDTVPLVSDVERAVQSSSTFSYAELQECRFVKNTGIRKQHVVLDFLVR
nr:methyltransferase [Candidatus Sigynarchaeota archaeon]